MLEEIQVAGVGITLSGDLLDAGIETSMRPTTGAALADVGLNSYKWMPHSRDTRERSHATRDGDQQTVPSSLAKSGTTSCRRMLGTMIGAQSAFSPR